MPPNIGRRIAVFGWTGSGKTTVAQRIGASRVLPVIELDAIYWRLGNWQPLPPDEFREAALRAIATSTVGWVCDGNYASIRNVILSQADTVVLLRLPLWVTYARILKRSVRRSCAKEDLWGTGNREPWHLVLTTRHSILPYAWNMRRNMYKALIEDIDFYGRHANVIELRSTRAVRQFLTALEP